MTTPTPDLVRLSAWKTEALIVIEQWEQVWVELGKPGDLGLPKALTSLKEVKRLKAENADLREWAVDGALYDVYLELLDMAEQLVKALASEATWYCCGDSFYGPCDCPPDTPRSPDFRSGTAGLTYGLAVALLDRIKG